MNIVGLSAFYHDSAVALVKNGVIAYAAQEERFTRKKHDPNFPHHALQNCLIQNHLTLDQIDYFVFYEKPFLKFERLLETYLNVAPRGFSSFLRAMPLWAKEKLFQKKLLQRSIKEVGPAHHLEQKILFSDHHLSHAASAFYPSPFDEALILVMDSVGEWATTSVAWGQHDTIHPIKEIHFPHSIGLLYSAFTYYLGFKVNSGEYKVMGLAPYGEPCYTNLILNELVDIKEDGSFTLNMDYFDFAVSTTMVGKKFETLFHHTRREPETPLQTFHANIAASIQRAVEHIILNLVNHLSQYHQTDNLCLAGGVALNCVANTQLLTKTCFSHVWIQPAAGDAGGALGAALAIDRHLKKETNRPKKKYDLMQGGYLGPTYSGARIVEQLNQLGARFTVENREKLIKKTAQLLSEGLAVGWFQDRMEFGPRALGNRSILADPRQPEMQSRLNLKIKFRESFRPFAPSVLEEDASTWFEVPHDSPYMLLISKIHPSKLKRVVNGQRATSFQEHLKTQRSLIPAVTHVDLSARLQTVSKTTNPLYHDLLTQFKRITGCPVLVNTSFNIRGEPIVCSPTDAFRCFMGTDLDALVIGHCVLLKSDQDKSVIENYTHLFPLD